MQFRQGDICITRISKLPGKTRRLRRLVIQGETRNSHVFSDGGSAAVAYYESASEKDEGMWYVVVKRGEAQITHNEHKTIYLPKGIYRVTQARGIPIDDPD
jgi:hypothetical protein